MRLDNIEKEFSKLWMKKCNPDLILRFWRSKGSPGRLLIHRYGLDIQYTNTPFGELHWIVNKLRP